MSRNEPGKLCAPRRARTGGGGSGLGGGSGGGLGGGGGGLGGGLGGTSCTAPVAVAAGTQLTIIL